MIYGTAKEELLNHYNNSSEKFLLNNIAFDDLPLFVQQSYIIKWFDSVGVYIDITPYAYNDRGLEEKVCFNQSALNHQNIDEQNTYSVRESATTIAIDKASKIFNSQNINEK